MPVTSTQRAEIRARIRRQACLALPHTVAYVVARSDDPEVIAFAEREVHRLRVALYDGRAIGPLTGKRKR